jgi:hypothetical protein
MGTGTYAVESAPKLQAAGPGCKPFRPATPLRPLLVRPGIEPRG